MKVAIVAMGPSSQDYVRACSSKKDFEVFDQVWVINSMLDVVKADLCFIMDDLKDIERRYPAWSNKIKTTKTPVMTCRAYEDYPTSQAFPIEEVCNCVKDDVFSTTPAYMVGYAIYKRVSTISLFGVDYSFPGGGAIEPGEAAVAYLLGIAKERGIKNRIPHNSSLLDANLTVFNEQGEGRRLMYGFDYNPGQSLDRVTRGCPQGLDHVIASKAPFALQKGEK